MRLAAVVAILTLAAGCGEQAQGFVQQVGDPERGARLVDTEACGSCHVIPGHATGRGTVGPPLSGVADRSIIAGVLANTPDNLTLWLEKPQSFVPGNGMPSTGLSPQQARDIAAYLYTLH